MNTRKLIKFKETEYKIKVRKGEEKLSAWNNVVKLISTFIQVPEDSSEYKKMLIDPLGYVSSKIDSEHRPNINIPIKTEKLLELLEIDLSPLKHAFTACQKIEGSLIVDKSCKVSFVVNEEDFKVYAETETELKQLEASLKLIEAYKTFMIAFDSDFMKHGDRQQNELRQATGNRLNWENGKLVPSEYMIKYNR